MAMEIQALLQGSRIQPGVLPKFDIETGWVCILHSGFGIEGVFTDPEIFRAKIKYLRSLNAYRAVALSFSMHQINPESQP